MRIIAGRHRGRRLTAPKGEATRPTSDRAREALFGILEHGKPPLRGCRFLDVFAGSGAVALEALSRGAARACLIENAPAALAAIRANLAAAGESERALLIVADATRLGPAPMAADIAFLDPPYRSGLLAATLNRLAAQGWFAPGARVVGELAAGEPPAPPPAFAPEDERRYGAARFVFLRRVAGEQETVAAAQRSDGSAPGPR